MGWSPLPTGEGPEPRQVREGLDQLLRSLGGSRRGGGSALFARWQEVVGEQVAAHARPLRVDADRLVVAVDEPAWATQLRFLERDLLARLAGVAGDGAPTRLEVRVRPR